MTRSPAELAREVRDVLEREFGHAHSVGARAAATQANRALAALAELQAQAEAGQHIRPLRQTEWDMLMREHDVVHEARRLSNTPGVINTTRDLDRALKRYDEAQEADRVAAAAAPPPADTEAAADA